MNQYYLIAQLPSLDGISDSMPLPITYERFCELCERFLSKKALNELSRLTLMPPRKSESTSSEVVAAWNAGERNLRLVLAKLRSEKLKKLFEVEELDIPAEMLATARHAVSLTDPMEAEKALNRYRLDFLETLRPADAFSQDTLFYYGLKLRLLLRIRQFDQEAGESAYKNIYNAIMNGDTQ